MTMDESVDNLARRAALAEHALHLLRAAPHVVGVEAYGSLAAGRADRYADIDLVVRVQGIADRAFAQKLPTLLAPLGPFLVEGWGLAFLPDTYVRTLYPVDYPLFWHLDIGCLSDQHEDGTDLKRSYHWPQIFKMWIAAVKALLRGDDQVDALTAHIARWADVSDVQGSPAQRLARLLDLCAARARQRKAPYAALYARCDALRQVYLQP